MVVSYLVRFGGCQDMLRCPDEHALHERFASHLNLLATSLASIGENGFCPE